MIVAILCFVVQLIKNKLKCAIIDLVLNYKGRIIRVKRLIIAYGNLSNREHQRAKMFLFHHKSIFFPALLIIIGALALLTNLGVLSVAIWEWWPILFVVFGVYLLIWQKRKKNILKGLMWYGAVNKLMKSEKVEKLLENENIQKELGKIGVIVEGAITAQINKLHKKFKKK